MKSTLKTMRFRRKMRTRKKITGTAARPRLSIFKSNRFISVQMIDDEQGKTLISLSTRDNKAKMTLTKKAYALGEALAEKATKVGVNAAVLDRGRYSYHGHMKAIAEGARSKNLHI